MRETSKPQATKSQANVQIDRYGKAWIKDGSLASLLGISMRKAHFAIARFDQSHSPELRASVRLSPSGTYWVRMDAAGFLIKHLARNHAQAITVMAAVSSLWTPKEVLT